MIEITNYDHYGRGIGKLNNKVIFIKNAIPGEIIEPLILKDNKRYAEGIVKEYLKVSNNRVIPKCKYYNTCGGCDIMHLSYKDQLAFKQQKVKNIVTKYLNNSIHVNKIEKCDNDLGYRNKVTFHIKDSVGFFKKDSNEFISADKCLICNNKINESIKFLNLLDLKEITKVICRTNGKDLMIILESNNNNINIDCLKEIADSIYIKDKDKYILKYGKDNIFQNLGENKYTISPDSFFQINTNVAKKLYDKVKDLVGKNKNVIDLYCGTGSIGLYLDNTNQITGVELNKSAYLDAIKNKDINKKDNIDFICLDSGKALKSMKTKPDLIIVDPPRNGLNKETIKNILDILPKEIIYVSCDIMTLMRDLNILNNKYEICEITPFDMFPNTYHVECVVLLKLK